MGTMNLKIVELRKLKQVGQQELAEVLGVTFQAVSKWETGITMPDIALLPDIAEYFDVSVDELLGLKPLPKQIYIQRNTDDRTKWNEKTDKLFQNRRNFWNDDYLKFLVEFVWKITKPIHIIDFWCGDGFLGKKLMELLPYGSTYTGLDNEYFLRRAQTTFQDSNLRADFIETSIYNFKSERKYDLAICQACLRHLNRPQDALKQMIESVKSGGRVVCVEVNREFENDGTIIEGIDYDDLCTNFDYHPLWRTELANEGRDYAIGMKVPFYMDQLGLHDIDVRMNDKAMFINPKREGYEEDIDAFIKLNGYEKESSIAENESVIQFFMSRGMSRADVERLFIMQNRIAHHFAQSEGDLSVLKVQGLLISSGIK